MTVWEDCSSRPMSVRNGPNHLYTDRPIFSAARELIRQTESGIQGRLEQPVRLILTGGAAMALYSPTRSSNDVDAIFSHRIILPEVSVPYLDEQGARRLLTWDRNYSPVLGLMHPDAENEAIFVAHSPDKKFDVLVLSPLDLAVSKLGRYADNDQSDIRELFAADLITPQSLEDRADEAMHYFVGNLGQVHQNLTLALEGVGYKITKSRPDDGRDYHVPQPVLLNDAQRLAKSGENPVHCLSRGQITGRLLSLSDDRSLAFLSRAGSVLAIYRSDFGPMSDLSPLKGKLVTISERHGSLQIRERRQDRAIER